MANIFLVSDTHFSHAGVCRFMRADGVTKLRPWDNVEEMDEHMIDVWNKTVRPNDKVYHLGDVAINKKALAIMGRLNGDKVLIKGNHDIFHLEDYTPYFRDIRAYHVLNGLIMSHIPLGEASLGRFGTNIHGHLHEKRVMKARGIDAKTGATLYSNTEFDVRYHCVCVEQTDWAPIAFEDVQKRIVAEGGEIGMKSRESVYGPG
jgi:calcineurin-like phosphoesterase family protein